MNSNSCINTIGGYLSKVPPDMRAAQATVLMHAVIMMALYGRSRQVNASSVNSRAKATEADK